MKGALDFMHKSFHNVSTSVQSNLRKSSVSKTVAGLLNTTKSAMSRASEIAASFLEEATETGEVPTKLSLQRVMRLRSMLSERFEPGNAEHEEMLEELWHAAYGGSKEFIRIGPQWLQIGFQRVWQFFRDLSQNSRAYTGGSCDRLSRRRRFRTSKFDIFGRPVQQTGIAILTVLLHGIEFSISFETFFLIIQNNTRLPFRLLLLESILQLNLRLLLVWLAAIFLPPGNHIGACLKTNERFLSFIAACLSE